jgi:predicted metal-binding membrane protein
MSSGMGDATAMDGMPGRISVEAGLAFVLAWGAMMAAMMLPSAAPMILLFRAVTKNTTASGQHAVPTLAFAATYLVVWLAVGVPVYAINVGVESAAAASQTVAGLLPYALGAVLVVAGAYQFSALKRVCLENCQSPLAFLMRTWRAGHLGTLRIGVAHAVYCIGCCWGLMAVLVGAGAMGLEWVLLIAVVVFAEKLLPRGERTTRVVGIALVGLGLAVWIDPGLAATLRGQMAPGSSM